MLRRLVIASALLLPLASNAFADKQSDANARCIELGRAGIDTSNSSPEQKQQIDDLLIGMCGCITSKLAELGDDGEKALHIMSKMTLEQAQASAGDPAKDRQIAIDILVADYGMSPEEAGVLYDRLEPEGKRISGECQAEAMKSIAPPATP